MSKTCQEPYEVVNGKVQPCGRPAMAKWKDRYVCYGCLDGLEMLAEARKRRDEKQPNTPRR